MTTSGRLPVSDFAPGRRSLLLGGIGFGSASALALGTAGSAAASQATDTAAAAEEQQQPPQIDFDFDNGNYFRDLQSVDAMGSGDVAPMDVTILIRINDLMTHAWFDALAPYHPTAVGVYSRLGRRPSSESATNRNMNIAAIYATYQVIQGVFPERAPLFRQVMTALGLDPSDESEDRTSPVGIGNLAGKAVMTARLHDGINQLGDEGRTYNGRPYQDYTGYRPVNTAYELTHPSRWQPNLGTHNRRQAGGGGDKGIFTVQHFASPHMELVQPHTYTDPSQFRLAPPRHSQHHRRGLYRHSVDEVLAASAALTDERKVTTEFFDNKLLGVRASIFASAEAHELDLHGWVQLFLVHTVAMYDSLIACWHYKRRYDSVRPFSAIRYLYGSSPVTAWGGVGMGTVDDLPADQWTSYLQVGDHPEYPSGSTVLHSAEAAASQLFLDSDRLDLTWTVPAGGSVREPGITPGGDIELHWDTWTDFAQSCSDSRLWAGVHFSKTNERSLRFGEQFGELALAYLQRYVNGDVRE